MRLPVQRVAAAVGCALSLCIVVAGAWAEQSASRAIGMFTIVQGQVTRAHPGATRPIPVAFLDEVLARDTIEAQQNSRTKALLNDDSILTVGEESRVEITEYLYDQSQNRRSVVVNLVKGKVRALVNKVFTGPGSRFEIHTPTAVAAARGTYFVAWYAQGMSGVANIGTHGQVDFTAEGVTVEVPPGHYTLTVGRAPLMPSALTGHNVPSQAKQAVAGTEVKERPRPETPLQAIRAQGGGIPFSPQAGPPGVAQKFETKSATDRAANSGGVGGTPVEMSASTVTLTPPAVISGTVSGSAGPNLSTSVTLTPPAITSGSPSGVAPVAPSPASIGVPPLAAATGAAGSSTSSGVGLSVGRTPPPFSIIPPGHSNRGGSGGRKVPSPAVVGHAKGRILDSRSSSPKDRIHSAKGRGKLNLKQKSRRR